jgi:uncharacterized metal-binding protein YceD (DUF177 family)
MTADSTPWSSTLRLADVQRTSPTLELSPDPAQLKALAKLFDLEALNSLKAEVRLTPWLDGAELRGRWRAEVTQICGVTVEPFDSRLSGEFTVRVVPSDSPAAVHADEDVAVDPEADDPPDVLESDVIDVAAYVVEHVALEIDPFPRKPGVEFEPPPEERPASPFAVLQSLKTAAKGGGDDPA